MEIHSSAEVRSLVIDLIATSLREAGHDPARVGDEINLLESGVLDSLGLLSLISDVEDRLGTELELSDAEPEDLAVLGRFCRQVERQLGG
jgi:acyl carrier protein